MAYGQMRGTKAVAPATKATTGTGEKREYILSTGLFAPTKAGVKSLGSVQVKESVTIPAGAFINLYENDNRTSEKQPVFRLTIAEGNKKK